MRHIVSAKDNRTFWVSTGEDHILNPEKIAINLAELLANATQAPAVVHRQDYDFLPATTEVHVARRPQ